MLCAAVALASAQACQSGGRNQPPFVHKKKYVMGTVFEIVAYGESPEQASDAIDQAFQEIVRLDDVMSDYKADSALSRLNHSSHSTPQTVPPDLYRIIGEALQYSRLSGGKFDVTVGPLVNLWKAAIRGGPRPFRRGRGEGSGLRGISEGRTTSPGSNSVPLALHAD